MLNNEQKKTQVLKEIVYFLSLMPKLIMERKSIILSLCQKYDVRKESVKALLYLENRYSDALRKDLLETYKNQTIQIMMKSDSNLGSVISMCFDYLESSDIEKLLLINKALAKELKDKFIRHLFRKPSLSKKNRESIYRMLVPKTFQVIRSK